MSEKRPCATVGLLLLLLLHVVILAIDSEAEAEAEASVSHQPVLCVRSSLCVCVRWVEADIRDGS